MAAHEWISCLAGFRLTSGTPLDKRLVCRWFYYLPQLYNFSETVLHYETWPCSTVGPLLEKILFPYQIQSIRENLKNHDHVGKNPTLFWNKWIVHTETHTHTHTHIHIHTGTTVFPSNTDTLILSSHFGLSPQKITFLHVLRKKIVWIFLLSHAFYIPCPFHIPRLGHLNNVEWRSSSLCSFLHSPITSCMLGPHILFSQHSKTLVLRDKPKILRRWIITEVEGTNPWRRKQKYLAVQPYICVVPLIRKTTLYTHIPNTSGWAQGSNCTDRVIRNVTCLVKLQFHSLVRRVKTGTTVLQS
jgi:hypothetical protein